MLRLIHAFAQRAKRGKEGQSAAFGGLFTSSGGCQEKKPV
jgi:hypothetical protein